MSTDSYCLKTGGLIFVEDEGRAFESDLHIFGDMLIAVCAHPATYLESMTALDISRMTVTVSRRASIFHMDRVRPHSTLVVRTVACRISDLLKTHIKAGYPTKYMQFDNYTQGV